MLGLKLNHVSKRGHWGNILVKFEPEPEFYNFLQENAFEDVVFQSDDRFVQVEVS